MEIHFLRQATLVITLNGVNFLIDPMLSPSQFADPVANTPNQQRNPLVELPVDRPSLISLLRDMDAVLVTHTHSDHWDQAAIDLLPKQIPIFCQPEDKDHIQECGFTETHSIDVFEHWNNIEVVRTGGEHGTGEIGLAMSPVSGFVLKSEYNERVYIAGDTIWCPAVKNVLLTHQPDVIVVNAGAAQFLTGDPITMTAYDVIQVCETKKDTMVVAVHMEAINTCLLSRKSLQEELKMVGCETRVRIPMDGERLLF